jgi:hypothetical protein
MRYASLLLVTVTADTWNALEHSNENLAGTTDTTTGTFGFTRAQMESKTHSPGGGFAWQEQTHNKPFHTQLTVGQHEAESDYYKHATKDTFEHENRIGANFADDTKQYVPEGFDTSGPIKAQTYNPRGALACCKHMCHTQNVDTHYCKLGCHKWLLNALPNWNMDSYGYKLKNTNIRNEVSNGELLLRKCQNKCRLNERNIDATDNIEACEAGCNLFKNTCHIAESSWVADNASTGRGS